MQVFSEDWGSHSTKLSCSDFGEIILNLMDSVGDPSSHAPAKLGLGCAHRLINRFVLAKNPLASDIESGSR